MKRASLLAAFCAIASVSVAGATACGNKDDVATPPTRVGGSGSSAGSASGSASGGASGSTSGGAGGSGDTSDGGLG